MDFDELYPLTFEPLYGGAPWSGKLLSGLPGRETEVPGGTGNSWELIDRPGLQSVVAEGKLKGVTISDLMRRFGGAIAGGRFPSGNRFPLSVKLLDVGGKTSLQVHPRHDVPREDGGEPKSQMWYVMRAEKGAKIYAGLKGASTGMQFFELLGTDDIECVLQTFDACQGDAYYLRGGRIHAASGNAIILEIGQNSETNYRIFDWGREPDLARPLAVRQGVAAMDFRDRTNCRICAVSGHAFCNRKYTLVNKCPYFSTEELKLVSLWRDDTDRKSFHILVPVDVPIDVTANSHCVRVMPGRAVLIPACLGAYTVKPSDAASASVVRTSLQHS